MARKRTKQKTVNLLLRLPPDLHAELVAHADSHSPPNSLNREIIERLATSFTFPGMMPPAGLLSRLLVQQRADKLILQVPNDEVGKQVIEYMRTTHEEVAKLRAEIAAVGGIEYDWEGAERDMRENRARNAKPKAPRRRSISAAAANDDLPSRVQPKRSDPRKKGVA